MQTANKRYPRIVQLLRSSWDLRQEFNIRDETDEWTDYLHCCPTGHLESQSSLVHRSWGTAAGDFSAWQATHFTNVLMGVSQPLGTALRQFLLSVLQNDLAEDYLCIADRTMAEARWDGPWRPEEKADKGLCGSKGGANETRGECVGLSVLFK